MPRPCVSLFPAQIFSALRDADVSGRPLLHALSCVCVSDANKPHVLPKGDTRVLDACTTVLSWGTPGCPADGGGGRWSPLMVRHGCGGAAGKYDKRRGTI